MAQADMIYLRVEQDCKGEATCSEALAAGEQWEGCGFKSGDTYRGWIINHVGSNFVFLTGGSDLYLLPRDCCSLEMRADNPILDGRVSPR